MRGRLPKPAELHVIEGTLNVTRHAHFKDGPLGDGLPIKPKAMKGRASAIWDETLRCAPWLKESDSKTFFVWCCMAAEAERSVAKMTASRINNFRGLTSQLGLDPTARARMRTDGPKKQSDPAEGYFKPKAAG